MPLATRPGCTLEQGRDHLSDQSTLSTTATGTALVIFQVLEERLDLARLHQKLGYAILPLASVRQRPRRYDIADFLRQYLR